MAGGWGGILGLTGVWPSSPPSVSQAGWRSYLALTGIWVDGAGTAIGGPITPAPGGGEEPRQGSWANIQYHERIARIQDQEVHEIILILRARGLI